MSDAPDQDPRIGAVLQARYRVVSRVSAGAMGAVYRGERLQLGRAVAIKFLHAAFMREPEFQRRFNVEAQAMSRLGHPHCVSVIDFGVADVPYVIMEYVQGTTLRELLEHGRLPSDRALVIVQQLLAGLQHAHNNGVIHRDIKPANIMLTEATGTGDHVRILDFGLAKLISGPGGSASATAPMAIGTPSYMSPEQARGETVDARSDVYGAGILLYELLTGEKPFFAEEAFTIIRMQIEEAPPRLSEKCKDQKFSSELEKLVARALAKKPGDRFQTAAEFAEAIEATPEAKHLFGRRLSSQFAPPPLREEPTGTSEQTRPRGEPRQPSRSGARRTALLLALLLAVAASAAALYLRDHRPAAERLAQPVPVHSKVADAGAPPTKPPDKPTAATDIKAAATPDAGPPAALTDWLARPDDDGVDPSALDGEPIIGPTEPDPDPTVPKISTMRDVERLLKDGKRDEAYRGLVSLRRSNPKNAYIHYVLGNLQFEKLYYTDGLESYAVALNNSAYRRSVTLNQNVIRALGNDKTRRKAETLLIRNIGRAALPFLDRAAKNDKNKTVRARAAAMAARLRRKR